MDATLSLVTYFGARLWAVRMPLLFLLASLLLAVAVAVVVIGAMADNLAAPAQTLLAEPFRWRRA
jgi:hypothetical protein